MNVEVVNTAAVVTCVIISQAATNAFLEKDIHSNPKYHNVNMISNALLRHSILYEKNIHCFRY